MKKIKVLAILMVFAFAAIGGAYAMWSDTVFATENIATGTVDVNWDCTCTSDPAPNGADGAVYTGDLDSMDVGNPNIPDLKNVGSIDSCVDETGQLVITVDNAYPGYQEYTTAALYNDGTVPVKIQKINIVGDARYNLCEVTDLDGASIIGYQIEPNEELCVKINHRTLQAAAQNADYTYAISIQAVQWNEYSADRQYRLPNAFTSPRVNAPVIAQ